MRALPVADSGPHDVHLGRALGRVLHIDDQERLRHFAPPSAAPNRQTRPTSDSANAACSRCCTPISWGTERDLTLDAGFARLWENPARRDELGELLDVLDDLADVVPRPLRLTLPIPLSVHCRYTRDEVLAATGISQPERPYPLREGVKYDAASGCDLLFFTITKNEHHYSPSTMYRDYAISRRLIHWESQSTTTERSPTGQRYIHHAEQGSHVLLFVRETPADRAYTFLGTAQYVSHTGERPMAVTWELDEPLPEAVFAMARVAAG